MKPKLSRISQACQPLPPAVPLLEALIVVKGVDAWLAVDEAKLARIRADDIQAELTAAEAWAMIPMEPGPLARAKHLVLVIVDGAEDITPGSLIKQDGLVKPMFTPQQAARIVEDARAACTRH